MQRGDSPPLRIQALQEKGGIYSSPCTDLNCNTRKLSSQPGFLNKNQSPTLRFRPVNRAASAGEIFLCALRPPSWCKHQASAPSRSSSLQAANREGSGRFPLSGPGSPAAQRAAGEAQPSGTAPPSSSREFPAPPARQKAQGKGAPPTLQKQVAQREVLNQSQTRIAAVATPTRLPLGTMSNPRSPN